MKNEIIKKTAEIIADINAGKKTLRAEASTCGHLVDEWLREYEENAEDYICKATENEIEEAFNDCVDYGCEEITPEELLRQIASKAECHDEHASIDRVNVWEVR